MGPSRLGSSIGNIPRRYDETALDMLRTLCSIARNRVAACPILVKLLRFGQRGYVCQSGRTTLKFNGAIQTRESGKLFVPPQFSQSPRERQ